jgi:site-specific recombinase XerD
VRSVAARAELKLSAHTLRHTCVTNLVRSGNDLVAKAMTRVDAARQVKAIVDRVDVA